MQYVYLQFQEFRTHLSLFFYRNSLLFLLFFQLQNHFLVLSVQRTPELPAGWFLLSLPQSVPLYHQDIPYDPDRSMWSRRQPVLQNLLHPTDLQVLSQGQCIPFLLCHKLSSPLQIKIRKMSDAPILHPASCGQPAWSPQILRRNPHHWSAFRSEQSVHSFSPDAVK